MFRSSSLLHVSSRLLMQCVVGAASGVFDLGMHLLRLARKSNKLSWQQHGLLFRGVVNDATTMCHISHGAIFSLLYVQSPVDTAP